MKIRNIKHRKVLEALERKKHSDCEGRMKNESKDIHQAFISSTHSRVTVMLVTGGKVERVDKGDPANY